jgi:hypothetical protein
MDAVPSTRVPYLDASVSRVPEQPGDAWPYEGRANESHRSAAFLRSPAKQGVSKDAAICASPCQLRNQVESSCRKRLLLGPSPAFDATFNRLGFIPGIERLAPNKTHWSARMSVRATNAFRVLSKSPLQIIRVAHGVAAVGALEHSCIERPTHSHPPMGIGLPIPAAPFETGSCGALLRDTASRPVSAPVFRVRARHTQQTRVQAGLAGGGLPTPGAGGRLP